MIFSAWLVSSGIFKDVFDFDNSTWYHVFFSFFFQQNTKHCFISREMFSLIAEFFMSSSLEQNIIEFMTGLVVLIVTDSP